MDKNMRGGKWARICLGGKWARICEGVSGQEYARG